MLVVTSGLGYDLLRNIYIGFDQVVETICGGH
jgi:hypothetical protein